jgi:hypothetical protein
MWQPGLYGELWLDNTTKLKDSGTTGWGSFGGDIYYDFTSTSLVTYGPGRYEAFGLHSAFCPYYYCGVDRTLPIYDDMWDGWDSGYLDIVPPTISGLPYVNALWNLGSGTADSVLSSPGVYYYQKADLTFQSNCVPAGACTSTPVWTISSSNNQATLSTTSGSTTTLSKGSSPGNCQFDTTISVSIDGFSSDSVDIVVNSPTALWNIGESTNPVSMSPSFGYETSWVYVVKDACPAYNVLVTLPRYETFGTFTTPGVINGWTGRPTATSSASFNFPGNPYQFIDYIAAWGPSSWNPAPSWSSSSFPYLGTTLIVTGPQTWSVGSVTSPNGTQVFSGNINYYQDHGTAQ